MLTAVNRQRGDDPLPFALALLAREGPSALTMRNVAAAAGVTATALYRHYPDKDALIRAVVRAVHAEFRRHLVAELPTNDSGTWLRLAFDRYMRFGLEYPNFYRMLFAEPHGFGIDRYPDDFKRGKSVTFRHLRDIVARAMTDRILTGDPDEDATDVALTLYAHMHGLMMLRLGGRFPNEAIFKGFFLQSMERLIEGLRR